MKFRIFLFVILGMLFVLSPVFAVDYNVSISITPKEIEVKPCGIATYDVDVKNLGELEDTYSIVLEGIPEGWATLTEDSITLEPGKTEKIYLFITPYCYAEEYGLFEGTISAIGQAEDSDSFVLNVVPDHVIEITMPEELRVCLGEEDEIVATVKNTGEHDEEVVLTASGDASDFVEITEESFTLGVGEEKNITIMVKPVEIELGSYALEIKAESTTSYARSSASTLIEVTECYKVVVTYPEEVSACAGITTSFEIMIENVGVKNDSYELRVEQLDFLETVDLAPGEAKTFEIDFLEEEEGTYNISFVVESEFTREEGVIKFIVSRCYAVDLTVEKNYVQIESGKGKLIKGNVKNIGTMADTFKIISDVIWSAIRPEEVTLSPDESEDVYAYYSPEFGAKGTYPVKLTARSDKSEDTEDIEIEVLPKEVAVVIETTTTIPETTTTVEEVTTIPEETTTTVEILEETTTTLPEINITEIEIVEETTTTMPLIPTGEVVAGFWESRVLRSLLIAIIVVIIILIVIYLVVMR